MSTWDLAVVGGGTAGLTAAVGAARIGARVLLVERDRTGGDCLWTGCVPSKALLAAAEHAHAARQAGRLGVDVDGVRVDLARVMAHVKRAIARIEPHDAPERLEREGVTVRHGHARFTAPGRLEIDGREERFRRAMVATGARPLVPDLPGLAAARPLTSDTVWGLTELPSRLVVLGGGPIGVELGQAFARLGSRVTMVEMDAQLLPREEPEAAAVVARRLTEEGVGVRTSTRAVAVHGGELEVEGPGGSERLGFDELLVAVGRRPNTDDLGLERIGVEVDARGAVTVDDRLRTTADRMFAGGDVTMRLPFTHVAGAHGATVVQNAVVGLRARVDHERIPWVTFSSPEVARVGLTAAQARRRFGSVVVRTSHHADLDRAIAVDDTDGFATLVGDRRGRIVGATVVGPRAGESIGEVAAWMAGGAKVGRIVRTTHPYPTWSEDLVAASLEDLNTTLARLRPLTRALVWLRRATRR
jgi:pyruvate/2-oxoglutarate dehydrogenase complex dihydrolipoamide dehydrogenase (E3) component